MELVAVVSWIEGIQQEKTSHIDQNSSLPGSFFIELKGRAHSFGITSAILLCFANNRAHETPFPKKKPFCENALQSMEGQTAHYFATLPKYKYWEWLLTQKNAPK